ncbi:hypothetical protein FSP39_011414 [Pinctada imbricata]|uniref:PH domain-containing protein n=1 Tax=Pinctada imbricata TaxID=66713 RepID=A0AA88Y755_PINIB|nr:hypothetical protein FSP39_011414 [Pinctada imbricata]
MNKIANVVYSGWMVKSPPERKFRLTGAWKIFRAKWKRRFFVLFKPEGSLPHQYVLNYYSDEHCRKPKGYIDLEHCEQIIESLDLDLYPYLLAIKTYHKNKERTYFLATETEEQMSTWVRNLCSVCGLKPEDDSSDLPEQRHHGHGHGHETLDSVKPLPHPTQNVAAPVVNSNIVTQQPTVPLRGGKGREQDGEEYIPISECRSHPIRQDSINSIPDEPAPPPPDKIGANSDLDNEVFHPSTYDTPKSRDQIDNVYKVPPPRIKRNSKEETTLDVYDIPPTRQSPSTPRSSSSESQKADSAYSSQSGLGQTYDYPPSHNDRNLTADDVYDVPPPNPQTLSLNDNTPPRPDAPPVRPPKPNNLHQEQYQNLPPNSKAVQDSSLNGLDLNRVVPPTAAEIGMGSYDIPKSSQQSNNSMYDMPKPAAAGSNLLSSAVPPPQFCGFNKRQHNYLNAGKGYVPGTKRSDSEDNYLPMDGSDSSANTSLNKSVQEGYLDMSHNPQDDYDTPPPARPPPPPRKPANAENDDTYTIFSTSRTRSFKRHGSPQISPRSEGNRPMKPGGFVELPSRADNCHPDCSTSSEDEEEEYLVDPSKVMMPYYIYSAQNHAQGRTNLWGSTPPAPKAQEDLKYLDLDLQDDEPRKSPSYHHGDQSTPTDYKEIDFVKTNALASITRRH